MTYLIYVTTPDKETALMIAQRLIEEKLSACANILPGATSIYRWEGNMEQAEETVMTLKTSKSRLEAAIARIKALHPYEVPCIATFEIQAGDPAYLQWINESTP